MVIASCVGVSAGQFSVTESADERDRATQRPNEKKRRFASDACGDNRRCFEDSGADDNANDYGHRVYD